MDTLNHTSSSFPPTPPQANDNGDYFPLWGTCLGFELLGYLATDKNYSVLSAVDAENLSLPLDFKYLERKSEREREPGRKSLVVNALCGCYVTECCGFVV